MAERHAEMERQGIKPPAVAWVLDPTAIHCWQCPEFAGIYESMTALLAATGGILPGFGTVCDGRCRCDIVEL